jgi:hypothetical protein
VSWSLFDTISAGLAGPSVSVSFSPSTTSFGAMVSEAKPFGIHETWSPHGKATGAAHLTFCGRATSFVEEAQNPGIQA